MLKAIGLFVVLAILSTSVSCTEKQAKAGPLCELCTIVLSAAENLLQQNKTEDQIVEFLEKNLCGRLGSLNSTCVQYMDAYGKLVIYELSQKVDPTVICHGIGLCAAKPKFMGQRVPEPRFPTQEAEPETIRVDMPNLKMQDIPQIKGLNCTLCKLVFTQVQNMLKNNASEQQLISFIEANLCTKLGPLEAPCKSVLEKYGPAILTDLAKGVDPEKLCILIGMCTKRQAENIQQIFDMPRMQPPPRDALMCTVCQYAIQFLDEELKNNKTDAAIIDALDKVCKLAPESMRAQCHTLINTYGIYLIQFIIQLADPIKVCQEIKLCPPHSTVQLY